MSQKSFFAKFDIFAFKPTPRGTRVSSAKSRLGTRIFLLVFISYIALTALQFLENNVPSINQYFVPLDERIEHPSPEMSFAFQLGDDLNETYYDETYFKFVFYQVTSYGDTDRPDEYEEIPLVKCRPEWMDMDFDSFCPSKPTVMRGFSGSEIFKYPALRVYACVNTTNTTCFDEEHVRWKLMTGRLFVYVQNYPQIDYRTGALTPPTAPFVATYYFMVWDLFDMADQKVNFKKVVVKPDLFNSFTTKTIQKLSLVDQTNYVSQVNTKDNHPLFQYTIKMDDDSINVTVVFHTTLDILSKWGAMWSLLFSVFALYFLRFNRENYYKEKPEMAKFESLLDPIVGIKEPVSLEATHKVEPDIKFT